MAADLLIKNEKGLYCPRGDFYIDPWAPVDKAVITHAHGDHARSGSQQYLCAAPGERPLKLRVGGSVETLAYGERLQLSEATLSLHPAGHVLGSAQVRVEIDGEVWVVSGDYKREADPTCVPFEPVPCHTFITESTFGLPIYRWQPADSVLQQILAWWAGNQQQHRPSILLGYVMGKTQRILATLAQQGELPGPLFAHGTMQAMNQAYRDSGVALPDAPNPVQHSQPEDFNQGLIFAPPSALGTPWLRRFKQAVIGRASGWMQVRGRRRRTAVDRGFILSDHADWPGLLQTIQETGAERVLVTHGSVMPLSRFLNEQGLSAEPLPLAPWAEQPEAQ